MERSPIMLPIVDRVSAYEEYEFPFCEMAHEALLRDEQGRPTKGEDKDPYVKQCPQVCRMRRPACAHFTEDDHGNERGDPVRDDIALLIAENVEGSAELLARYTALRKELNDGTKGGMDLAMREARCGTSSGGDTPSRSEARKAAAVLLPQHEKIVMRMKVVISDVEEKLRTLLHSRQTSSRMDSCEEQSSSPSGSLPMQPSSSEPMRWHTSSGSDSSSQAISRSETI